MASPLVAVGVSGSGERRILGLELAAGNDEGSAWPIFIRSLVERGLSGVRLDISDDHRLVKAVREIRGFGATQTFIRAGRPANNGAVERVQRTILEERWRPSFARSLVPKLTGLTRDPASTPAVSSTKSAPTPVA